MEFPEGASIFRYRPAAWLKITGEDAPAYLQGQISQDLKRSSYGLILNHKGKILADVFVVAGPGEGEFRVMSHEVPAGLIQQRLEEFIIADDVVIEDLTDKVEAVSLIGAGVGEWLASQGRGGRFPGRRMNAVNWEWVVPIAAAAELFKPIAGAEVVLPAEMERRRILDKIPSIPRDTAPPASANEGLMPGDLPQEVGLGEVAVAYDKGCYVGQEVMARLHGRGKVRRRLRLVRGALPPAGSELWLDGKVVGSMRSSVGEVGLAMMTGEPAVGAKLALAADGIPEIELRE